MLEAVETESIPSALSFRRQPEALPLSQPLWQEEWETLRAPSPARSVLDDEPHSRSCDVAIVGAGLTGLTTAFRLAQAGRSVVVLEADGVGSGASLRNAGFCTSSAPFSAQAAVKRHGPERGRELLRWFYGGPDEVRSLLQELNEDVVGNSVLENATQLVLATTSAQARQLRADCVAVNEALGATWDHRLEYVPREAVREHIGFGKFHGAIRDPVSACVNPARLMAALLRACESSGVRLIERARVSRIEDAPAGYRLKHARGEVTAERVILATNGYSTSLGVGSHRLVVPVGSYIIASRPLDPRTVHHLTPTTAVFSTSGRFPNYFRLVRDTQTEDVRLLFGGRRSLTFETSPHRVADELLADVERVLPGLAFDVERVWGGRLAFTARREPQMGELERGLYFVGGCCGHGVPTSISCANALASVLLGHRSNPPAFYRRRLSRSYAVAAAARLLPLIGAYYRARDRLDAAVQP